jgi:hypothetical protein
MTRYLAAAILVLAALALPATGASQTENLFCEIDDPDLVFCGDVFVQKTVENPCTDVPETVVLSGTIHVAMFESENQSRIHTNWQDVAGVALVTGTIYQANETTRIYEIDRPSGSSTFVLQDERTLVSKGGLQNFIVREYIEVTVDDDGVTMKEHGDTRCTG